jgi:hypothetical protein
VYGPQRGSGRRSKSLTIKPSLLRPGTKSTGFVYVVWLVISNGKGIQAPQERLQWWVFVKTVMNLPDRKFLTRWININNWETSCTRKWFSQFFQLGYVPELVIWVGSSFFCLYLLIHLFMFSISYHLEHKTWMASAFLIILWKFRFRQKFSHCNHS